MTTTMTHADIIKSCFKAYETNERSLIEPYLSDAFTFTSPYDDRISRDEYFQRCWPNSKLFKSLQLLRIIESGDEAFVTYEAEKTDGKRFRNTEFFTFSNHQLQSVEVFFGRELN